MGRVEGKVALITGAGRGQGRSHAVRLAQEGADIIAVDACAGHPTVPYSQASEADLAETAKQVEELDRRVLTHVADVRDLARLQQVVAESVAELGRLDIVSANAGVLSYAPGWELTEDAWDEMIGINLTGVWKTLRATVPTMIEQGTGGSIILTSSAAGLEAFPNTAHYTAAKHGVTGLMRTFAVELAQHHIRVNSVHPSIVDTDMINNPVMYGLLSGNTEASREEVQAAVTGLNAMPVPWAQPIDISNAVLWLASDESRYVTGTTQVIDAGALAPFKIPHG